MKTKILKVKFLAKYFFRWIMPLRESPAAKRNKLPIGEALQRYLSPQALKIQNPCLLEISSGCGTHVMHFSKLFPHVHFQPSDFQDESLASVQAHLEAEPRPNVAQPLKIDVCDPFDKWKLRYDKYDFMFNANMVHITAWKCTECLFANAGEVLKPDGILFMYGPFAMDGKLEPKSNEEFDKNLRLNNPDWGIRDLKHLEAEASRSDIYLEEVLDLPANNKLVIWRHKS